MGVAYAMESVTAFIAEQAQRRKQPELNIEEQEHRHTPVMPAIKEESLRLFVAKRIYNLNEPKYKNNLGLQQWAKLQNLKEMSRRFNFLCESGIHTEVLVQRVKEYQCALAEKTAAKSAKERQLKGINNLLRWEGQLNKTKAIYGQYRSLPANRRKQFWQQHQNELELHRSASKRLTEYKNTHNYNDKPLPSMKQLSAMKTTMGTELKTLSEEIALLQSNIYLLSTAQTDVMSACEKLNLVTRSEYAEIFGKRMSVRSQVSWKKGQPEKHSYDNNLQRQGGYGLE